MAETLTQRLQRIAAEKKAAAAKATLVELVTENTEANLEARFEAVKAKHREVTNNGGEQITTAIPEEETTVRVADSEDLAVESGLAESGQSNSSVAMPEPDSITGPDSSSGSTHPLVMEFAELSQALDSRDPEFKVILRKIHQQLGKDPDLVTQMTEQQIQQVVTGMIVFANAEIVAPAKAKSEKALVTAAKKKVINVDDL